MRIVTESRADELPLPPEKPAEEGDVNDSAYLTAIARRIAGAYVTENRHPDCVPEYRFRARLPQGETYAATREAAIDLVLSAVANEGAK